MTQGTVKRMLTDTLQDAASSAGKFQSSSAEAGSDISSVDKLKFTAAVNNGSKLGVIEGATVNGFTALGTAADNVIPSLDISVPLQVNNSFVPVQLTKNVTQVKDKLVKEVPSADATALSTITGSSDLTENGFLNVSVSAPFPDAIASTVQDAVPTVDKSTLTNISKNVVDLKDNSFSSVQNLSLDVNQLFDVAISSVVGNIYPNLGKGTLDKLKISTVSEIVSSGNKVIASIGDFGFASVIQNVVEKTLEVGSTVVRTAAVKNGVGVEVPVAERKRIMQFVSIGQYSNAADILSKYSDQSKEQLIDSLKSIDARGSTAVNRPTEGVSVKSKNINTIANGWQGDATTKSYFRNSIVDNINELRIELANINREVTQIVIGSTNTYSESDITAYDIHESLIQNNGLGENGTEELLNQRLAHYTIRINGVIERGLPIDKEIEATPLLPNNHHQRMIYVQMVGGNLSSSGADNFSAKAYSQKQWNALDSILSSAYAAYPGMQVIGINDTGSDMGGPYFDVIKYVKNKYNKKSAFNDPREQSPFTRANVIKINQGGL